MPDAGRGMFRGMQGDGPIPVDEPLVVQAHKGLGHGVCREAGQGGGRRMMRMLRGAG